MTSSYAVLMHCLFPDYTECLPPNSAQMEPATGCVSRTPGDDGILPIFEGVMLVVQTCAVTLKPDGEFTISSEQGQTLAKLCLSVADIRMDFSCICSSCTRLTMILYSVKNTDGCTQIDYAVV